MQPSEEPESLLEDLARITTCASLLMGAHAMKWQSILGFRAGQEKVQSHEFMLFGDKTCQLVITQNSARAAR